MVKIGIDFSVVSTGMCIEENGVYNFFWFPRKKSNKFPVSGKVFDIVKTVCEVNWYETTLASSDYSEGEKTKILDAKKLVEKIITNIPIGTELEIRIEGFSFGSKGQSMLDLVLFQGILRYELINGGYNVIFVPPKSLKKLFSGKGNASKDEMVNTFINLDINCSNVQKMQNIIQQDTRKTYKPYEDLVDAFALCIVDI